MENIGLIFILISVMFIFWLIVKSILRTEICAICLAVSSSWIILLFLMWFGIFIDKTLIALLIGQSIVGVFYIFEKKVKEELKFFRLPFILSLTFIGYVFLYGSYGVYFGGIYLGILWIIFILIFLIRKNIRMSVIVKKVIECCKNW